MGKLQALDILFAKNSDVFQPGEVIQGEVRIVINEEKGDIRGIQLECHGRAYTHWTESRGSGKNRRTVSYRWSVPFFDKDATLRGVGKDNNVTDRIVLPPGDHRIPFSIQIPEGQFPPPLEGTHGWVRYWIKVTIDRPWKFDHHKTRYFTLVTAKDLRPIPGILSPRQGSSEKTVCCCCCESGPIALSGSINKGGYVPGERLIFSVNLHNNSNRKIHNVKCRLMQKVTYRAKRSGSGGIHTRSSSKAVSEVKLDGCEEMGSLDYKDLPMLITPVAPNNFESCPNIDVDYIILLSGDVSSTPLDVEVPFPVVIGTIPAMSHSQLPPAQPQSVQPPMAHQQSLQSVPNQLQPFQQQPPQPLPVQQQPRSYPQPHVQQPGIPASPHQVQGYPSSYGSQWQGQEQQQQQQHPTAPPTQPPPTQSQDSSNPFPPNKVHPQSPHMDTSSEYQPAFDGAVPDDLPPPPTYEMVVGGAQVIAGEEGNFGTITYAPRYPFYNYGNALSELNTMGQPVTTQPQSSM